MINKETTITKLLIMLLHNRRESDVFVIKILGQLGIYDSAGLFIKNLISNDLIHEEKVVNNGYNGFYYSLTTKGNELFDNINKNQLLNESHIVLENMPIKQTIIEIINKSFENESP